METIENTFEEPASFNFKEEKPWKVESDKVAAMHCNHRKK